MYEGHFGAGPVGAGACCVGGGWQCGGEPVQPGEHVNG